MNKNNKGIFDTFTNLQQMGEQMSKMFCGDLARQWMGATGSSPARPLANGRRGDIASKGQTPSFFPMSQGGLPDWIRGMPGLDGLANMWGPGAGTANSTGPFPAVDVYETQEQVIVLCDIPGIERPSGIKDGQLELRLPKLRGSDGDSSRSVQIDFQ